LNFFSLIIIATLVVTIPISRAILAIAIPSPQFNNLNRDSCLYFINGLVGNACSGADARLTDQEDTSGPRHPLVRRLFLGLLALVADVDCFRMPVTLDSFIHIKEVNGHGEFPKLGEAVVPRVEL